MRLKPFACLFLILTMLPFIPNAYAEDSYTDYERNISLLNQLGAQINTSYEADEFVTRSQFTKYVVNMFGDGIVSHTDENYFEDVTESTENNEQINQAVLLGLIECGENRLFRPYDIVTYAEAVKITIAALGYNVMAYDKGGYPNGFLITADSIKLTKGVLPVNGNMNHGNAARLIMNMLDTETFQRNLNNSLEYSKGEKFLAYYRNIIKIKGRITANDITGLNDSIPAGLNNVIIEGEEYYIGATRADEMLGFEIVAFVERNKHEIGEIRAIVKTGTDKVYEYLPSEIEYTPGKIYCNNKRIYVDEKSPIIKNMTYYGNIMNVNFGSLIENADRVVILEDKNGNNAVFVTQYLTYVVDGVNLDNRIIYGKYDKGLYQIDSSTDVRVSVLEETGSYSLDYISEWNVLEMLPVESSNIGKRLYITIIDYPIKGRVTEIKKEDNGKTWYCLDGTEYQIANYLLNSGVVLPRVGEKAVFYCDSSGKIIAVDYKFVEGYGYLYSCRRKEGLDGLYYVKVYTAKGTHEVYPLAKKVTYNQNIDKPENVFNSLKAGNEEVPAQLIIYELNGKNEVKTLKTFTDKTEVEGYSGYDLDNFTLDYKLTTDAYVYRTYVKEDSTVRTTKSVSEDTIVFDIPKDLDAENKYKIDKAINFTDRGALPIGAQIYDIDHLGNATVILIERKGETVSKVSDDAETGIVNKISMARNDDDEWCYKIEFAGKANAILASDNDLEYDTRIDYGYGTVNVNNLKTGDYIQYNLDSDGYITAYRLIFRASNPDSYNHSPDLWGGMSPYYGEVMGVDGAQTMRYFSMSVDGVMRGFVYDQMMAKLYNKDAANIYIYSAKDRTISIGNASEIVKGDKLFIRVFNGIGQLIILVR